MKMDGLAIIRFFWVWPNFKKRYYYFTSDYNIAAVVILVGLLHCSLNKNDCWLEIAGKRTTTTIRYCVGKRQIILTF